MLKNYLTIALRNLIRNKGYTFINILGLAVGLTCCLFIVLYVKDELGYDKNYTRSEDIYRITADIRFNNSDLKLAVVGVPVAKTFKDEFPEVEEAVRFRQRGSFILKYKDKGFKEQRCIYADFNLFKVFSIQLIQGSKKTALQAPNSIVISETLARKIFGKEDPIGKSVKVDNSDNFKVSGVFKDLPTNTHLNFNLFASLSTLKDELANNVWLSHNFQTYVLLKPGTRIESLEAKFPAMFKKYLASEIKQFLGISQEDFEKAGNRYQYNLQPITSIHLHSDLMAELSANNDIKYIYIFSAIAVIILVIACINFMNLSTARSANRAKEVGIRKVVGGQKHELIIQFLSESVILTLISLALALLFVSILLPYFNEIASKKIVLSDMYDLLFLPLLLAIAVVVGLLAGSYPAFFLSNFQPVVVLKGKFTSGKTGKLLRSSLVVMQFSISIILIFSTLVVYRQLSFIHEKKLGFEKDQVLVLHDVYLLGDSKKIKSFKNELLRDPRISSGSVSGYLPAGDGSSSNTVYFPEGNVTADNARTMNEFYVDYDYLSTLGIKLLKGRNFSESFKTDSSSVIINRVVADAFGWKDPVGKKLMKYGRDNTEKIEFTVIGITDNFHYKSLRDKIEPLVIHLGDWGSYLSMKVRTKHVKPVIQSIQDKWTTFAPGQPFEYSFMDERFENTYKGEQQIGSLFGIFSGLAIFIACLGLFGLATFTAEQRIKEIGIRKVLGASIPNLIFLLSKDFTKLVVIAIVIAIPVAEFAMSKWLEDFAYRTSIGIFPIVFAGAIAIAIALLTMSFQSIKAALMNPVKSLRNE